MAETYFLMLGVAYAYALPLAALVLISEKLVNRYFKNKGE